jgi:hypothetical protein
MLRKKNSQLVSYTAHCRPYHTNMVRNVLYTSWSSARMVVHRVTKSRLDSCPNLFRISTGNRFGPTSVGPVQWSPLMLPSLLFWSNAGRWHINWNVRLLLPPQICHSYPLLSFEVRPLRWCMNDNSTLPLTDCPLLILINGRYFI